MIANKHISKIIIAIVAVAVVACFLAIGFSGKLTELFGGRSVRMEYESKLFDTDEIISIDIQMDEEAWNEMLSNAMAEEYYDCNVVINGERINHVAIRPKGNTSLSAIAMDPDTDRYSLKLEFDHYVEGQTCFGLDKLILNNNYADATNMKEAIIYDMYQYIGAEASLYNYAKVSVNGEYWGVYLALEAVEESFMLRNFGTQDGKLYKPDSMEMGGGASAGDAGGAGGSGGAGGDGSFAPAGGGGFDPSSMFGSSGFDPSSMFGSGGFDPSSMFGSSGFDPSSMFGSGSFDPSSMFGSSGFDSSSMPDMGDFDPSNMGDFDFSDMGDFDPSSMGGFSMGGGGANLNYTDDELDSYSTIWEGEITKTGKADHKKVVTALKNISEGTDLETYLDVDNVLKYMAVHTFAVNMDSLSGSMAHNYYLYEYDGQLNLFPWDYNLSFGGMSMGTDADATEVVNDAIDTPFSGTKFFDALLSNEEYLERYHAYLQQLVDEYVNGGRFDEVYNRIRNQIDSLVETDPTAFYTYKEYQTAVNYLYETIQLRAESIDGQLDGTIPSTDAGQRQDKSSLIDASHIDVKAMGQFNMGGSFGGGADFDFGNSSFSGGSGGDTGTPGDFGGDAGTPGDFGGGTSGDTGTPGDAGGFSGQIPEGFDAGNLPEGFDAGNPPEGFDAGNLPEGFDVGNLPEGFDAGNPPEGVDAGNRPDMGNKDAGNMPDMADFDFGSRSNQTNAKTKNLIIFGSCLALVIAALVVVGLVKRRKR